MESQNSKAGLLNKRSISRSSSELGLKAGMGELHSLTDLGGTTKVCSVLGGCGSTDSLHTPGAKALGVRAAVS